MTYEKREMSDERLSRAIATYLEPMPSVPPKWSHEVSANSAWKCKFNGYSHAAYLPNQVGYPEPIYEWVHQDFISDPAMTVMLLKHHGFASLTLLDEEKFYDVTFCGEEKHSVDCGLKMKTAQDADLGRAVALAFCAAHGLKVEE